MFNTRGLSVSATMLNKTPKYQHQLVSISAPYVQDSVAYNLPNAPEKDRVDFLIANYNWCVDQVAWVCYYECVLKRR